MNLQTMVSREFSPIDTAVVTVGKLTSGTRFNVVAGDAVMEGTTRTFSKEIRDSFAERITRIAKCTAEAMRGTAEVNYEYLVPVTTNDPKICDLAAEAVTKIFGEGKVVEADQTMGGEDFAFMSEAVPGVYLQVGLRAKDHQAALHNPGFDFNDLALANSVEAFRAIVEARLPLKA